MIDDEPDEPWENVPLFDVEDFISAPSLKPGRRSKGAAPDPREFGGWTLDKLGILERYLKVYRRVAGSGTFLDCFAGEGHATIKGQVVRGSPLIALDSGAFRRIVAIEFDRELATRLETATIGHRRGDRCDVRCGDSNLLIPDLLEQGLIDAKRPCFAFLDPDSTQLNWSTVEKLASFKAYDPERKQCKVELWILFNEQQAIQRLWPKDKTTAPPHAHVLDRVMGGSEAWRDLWEEQRGPQWLVGRYRQRLVALGYRHVQMQQILDPNTGRAQYWMVHATDHDAAVRFMHWSKRASVFRPPREPLPGFENYD